MKGIFLRLVFLSLVLLCVGFEGSFALASIPNFRQVTVDIFRGGRPVGNDLVQIKNQYGIKTDINLENTDYYIQREETLADRIGIDFFSYPMSAGSTPTDRLVNRILGDLQNQSKFPIFIHCKHGQDRTGLIVGLYRVLVQGYSARDAYREMLEIGYHPEYTALDNYFRRRTGYQGH